MPYTLKPNKLFAKDPNGDGYLPQNVITDKSTSDAVAEIEETGTTQNNRLTTTGNAQEDRVNAAGRTQVNAITAKATELRSTLSEANEAISKIDALNDIVAGLREVLDLVHPVGSVYISLDPTDPGQMFGGTWEQIKGRFLLSAGTPDDNTNSYWGTDLTHDGVNKFNESTPGSTGGESMHKLGYNEMPEHAHYANGKTADQNGEWTFPIMKRVQDYSGVWGIHRGTDNVDFTFFGAYAVNGHGYSDMNQSPLTGVSGGSVSHNNMPPYMVVYMWQRIS